MCTPGRDRGRLGNYDLLIGPRPSTVGETWIARAQEDDKSNSEVLVVRCLGKDSALTPEEVQTFSEAADWAASIKQEGAIPTTDVVSVDQQLGWVRPYVPGESLRQLLQHCARRRQAPTLTVALRIIADVLEAACPIAARPRRLASGTLLNCCLLGPDTVWISTEGRSRLTDVGLLGAACSLERFSRQPEAAAYRAPEQLGGVLAEPRSDVFAAGILLWELISGGRRLFGGADYAAVLGAVFSASVEEPGAPRSTRRQTDSAAIEIVMRALERDPTRRFLGLQDMLQTIKGLGREAIADRAEVVTYMSTVSEQELSEEEKAVSQLLGDSGSSRTSYPGLTATKPSGFPRSQPPTAAAKKESGPVGGKAQNAGTRAGRASSWPGTRQSLRSDSPGASLSARFPSARPSGAGDSAGSMASGPRGLRKAASQPTKNTPSASPPKSEGTSDPSVQRSSAPTGRKPLGEHFSPVSTVPRPTPSIPPSPGTQPVPGVSKPSDGAVRPSSPPLTAAQPADNSRPATPSSPLSAEQRTGDASLDKDWEAPSPVGKDTPRERESGDTASSGGTASASESDSSVSVAPPASGREPRGSEPVSRRVDSMPILSITAPKNEAVVAEGSEGSMRPESGPPAQSASSPPPQDDSSASPDDSLAPAPAPQAFPDDSLGAAPGRATRPGLVDAPPGEALAPESSEAESSEAESSEAESSEAKSSEAKSSEAKSSEAESSPLIADSTPESPGSAEGALEPTASQAEGGERVADAVAAPIIKQASTSVPAGAVDVVPATEAPYAFETPDFRPRSRLPLGIALVAAVAAVVGLYWAFQPTPAGQPERPSEATTAAKKPSPSSPARGSTTPTATTAPTTGSDLAADAAPAQPEPEAESTEPPSSTTAEMASTAKKAPKKRRKAKRKSTQATLAVAKAGSKKTVAKRPTAAKSVKAALGNEKQPTKVVKSGKTAAATPPSANPLDMLRKLQKKSD